MNLEEIVDNLRTDKNTTHSYLPLYQTLLKSKKESAKNVLEVGIGDFGEKNGGSIKLWKDYFIYKFLVSVNTFLSTEVEQLYFDFYGKILSGTPEMKPLWKRKLDKIL